MSRIIMSIETVKIKDFIFSTNKLKVIRGASYLLDYLNQVKVPEILEKNEVKGNDIIYIGAGNAKFFVSNEEKAQRIAKEINELYRIEAPGAKVATAFVETNYGVEKTNEDKNLNKNNKIWDDIDELATKIAIEKNKGFSIENVDLPFIEKCELCGTEPASIYSENFMNDIGSILSSDSANKLDDKNNKYKNLLDGLKETKLKIQIENLAPNSKKICECCLRKINAANQIKDDMDSKQQKEFDETYKIVNFYDYLRENMTEEEKKLKLQLNNKKTEGDSKIEDYEGEKSFIGFMYSDGDGLGDFLKHISNKFKQSNYNPTEGKTAEDDYIKFMKEFSQKLDETTKESMKDAIMEVFSKPKIKDDDKKGEFLIVGGDDVCAVFKPHLVLEISKLFQEKFEQKMVEYAKLHNIEDRITSSSGVIIAKSKTPMFQLFNQALSLQKKAKAKRQKIGMKTTGFIDFQVIGSEGCVDIQKFRENISLTNGRKNQVMDRPYAINSTDESKVKSIDKLFNIIKQLKESNFPKSKIRYIYDLKRELNMAEFEKKLDFINVLSKMEERHRNSLEANYKIDIDNCDTFNELFENIYDILEMYDFVGGGNNEN